MGILRGNAVVGQSGGPTSAINATLSGVIRGCAKSEYIKTLYGMANGIEGFLNEELIDLSYLFENEEALQTLEATPSSALGSCRKKLPSLNSGEDTYLRIFEIFKKYDIRYFFYIGGNDSMDTVDKIGEYAKKIDYEVRVIGVPKTIDNDLPITDHTPGFGSAGKFIATSVKEIACDCSVYKIPAVTIVEMMGRDAGWLTACAGLPSYFGSVGADLIYLPETTFNDDAFIESIKNELKKKPNVVVAVSEGIRYGNGRYVGEGAQSGALDAFGHKYLAGTAKNLEMLVKEKIGCKVRSIELNLPQRCSAHILSKTDILESVMIGEGAVAFAENGHTGEMMIFVREEKDGYSVRIDSVATALVANRVKLVPREYINGQGNGITSKCAEYIAPLIMGECNVRYENGLPVHLRIK